MKKFYFLVLAMVSLFSVNAQILFEEHFNTWDDITTGWSTVDFTYQHWHINASANEAGGGSYEITFDWYPYADNGMARYISPEINFTGKSEITFSFNHAAKHSAGQGSFQIGIATRQDANSPWNIVWDKTLNSNLPQENVTFNISNTDVNSATFQFCLFFDGPCENTKGWYFDDIVISTPVSVDANAVIIKGDRQFQQGDIYTPTVDIQNIGVDQGTIDATFTITDYVTNNSIYSETMQVLTNGGELKEVLFPDFTFPTDGNLYEAKLDVSMTGEINISNNSIIKSLNTYTVPRQKVLVEIGTGTWCGACPPSAIGAEGLVHNNEPVAVVEHHKSDNYAYSSGENRINYLGINGYPDAYFDTDRNKSGGCPSLDCTNEYTFIVDEAKLIRCPITLNVTAVLGSLPNTYDVTVVIDKLNPISEDDLRLQVVLTESHIQENWGTSPPLDHLDFVNRGFMPDENGTTVDLKNNTTVTKTITVNLETNPTISSPVISIADSCEIVVFVESIHEKKVYQTEKISLKDIILGISTVEGSHFEINPTPTSNILYVTLSNKTLKTDQYIITNIYGEVVKKGGLANGTNKLDVSKLNNGYYFLSIVGENRSKAKKIVIIK